MQGARFNLIQLLNLSLHQHSPEGKVPRDPSLAVPTVQNTVLVMLLNLRGGGSELVLPGQSQAEYSWSPLSLGRIREAGLILPSSPFSTSLLGLPGPLDVMPCEQEPRS